MPGQRHSLSQPTPTSFGSRVYSCLAVTCHLHFWQNDRGRLRATAVARGWSGQRIGEHTKLAVEKEILPPPLPGFELATFDPESGAFTNKLSRL